MFFNSQAYPAKMRQIVNPVLQHKYSFKKGKVKQGSKTFTNVKFYGIRCNKQGEHML